MNFSITRFEKNNGIFVFLLIAISSLAYINTLANLFVFDDNLIIVGNKWITDIRYLKDIFTKDVAAFDSRYSTSYYRPIFYSIQLLIYYLFELKPWAWHLVNIALHSAVSVVLYFVTCKLFFKLDIAPGLSCRSLSFITSLLFALHPIHTEAVAWSSGLPDLSYTLFCLLSFLLYIKSSEEKKIFNINYIGSVIIYFIATLCKEPALTLPLVIMAYDYSETKNLNNIVHNIKRYIAYFTAAIVYIVMRYNALHGFAPSKQYRELTNYEAVINALVLFKQFLSKLILPVNLNILHVFTPIKSIFELKGIIGLIVIMAFGFAIYFAARSKIIFVSLFLIFMPLLPALYIQGIGKSPLAERYLYLPSAGFVILLSFSLNYFIKKYHYIKITGILLSAMLVIYLTATVDRNKVWKNDLNLWADSVAKSPDSAMSHEYYGGALYMNGRVDEAIEQYKHSIIIDRNLADAHINLGVAYFSKGLIDEAIKEFLAVIEINPNYVEAYDYLGRAFKKNGFTEKAIYQFKRCIEVDPNYAEGHNQLAILYLKTGNIESAIREFNIALRINPTNKEYQNNLNAAMQIFSKRGRNPFFTW